MAKKTDYVFSYRHLSNAQRLSIVVVAIVCIIIQLFTLSALRNARVQRAVDEAKVFGENISSYMNLSLLQCVNATATLEYLYRDYTEGFFEDFDKIAAHLMEENTAIGSIYFSNQGVITHAYPEEVRKDTIGFDMFQDSIQSSKSIYAKERKRATIAGPNSLVEGGYGFIIRNPLFKENGEFLGFTIVVIDRERFFSNILENVNGVSNSYKVGIWKDDETPYVRDEYNFIFTNTDTDISRLVDIQIRVPGESWYLCIEPEEGWPNWETMSWSITISVLFIILVTLIVFYRQLENAKNIFKMQHDTLTGLYTRSAFYRRTRKILRDNPNESFDLLVADIENFKAINGIYGNKKCDELLKYYGGCLINEPTILLASRYGGDQFIVLFKSSDNMGIEYVEERTKIIIADAPIKKITIKFGFYGNIDRDLPINLAADRALLAARSILHNYEVSVANYNGPISKRHMREQMLESLFQDAITNGDFKVWYQPKFDAKTEHIVGLEALVRWIRTDGTPVSPADFVYIFEDDGLIVHLDEYVFRKVCSDIKIWYDQGYKIIPVSINVSRVSLHHSGIINTYLNILKETNIPMDSVSLEITETTTYSNIQIKDLAEQLKTSGFKLDMDDFGTGSSSLASLNIIPFDVVKLDKSLIDFIGTPDGEELIRHTIELAHFKNLKVVAEGVEDGSQLEFLRTQNCDIIQGYYYSKPLPYDDCINYIKQLHNEGRY